MIPYIIGSSRILIQMAVIYLLTLAAGVQIGLRADGPFDYLGMQLQMVEARTRVFESVAPFTERFDFLDQMTHMMLNAAMRGITIGYNAPDWTTREFVLAVAGYLVLIAFVVHTRAWRYTTTTHIK